MNKLLILIIGFFLLTACSSTNNKGKSQPKWVNENYRNSVFPSDNYYVHFEEKKLSFFSGASIKDIKAEFSKDLEVQIVKQIVEKISITTNSSELQTENNKIDYISSVLRESSHSASATLMGKRDEFYIDKQTKSIYGLIYVKKSELAKGYYSSISNKIDLLEGKIDFAKNNSIDNSQLKEFNNENKTIQNELEIYTIIISGTDKNLIEKYKKMYASLSQLNSIYGNDSGRIEALIIEADKMYQNQDSFESIIDKLDEALLYDSSNVKVLDKKKYYTQKWVSKLSLTLNSKEINKEYSEAISILDKLIVVDINNERVYKEKQKNIIELYYNETIEKIKSLIKNNSINESENLINQVSKYSYVNIESYNKVKLELDKIIIENSIRNIENLIYEKNYEQAAIVCKNSLQTYPDNKQLKNLLDKNLELIQQKKKQELKDMRSTRYVIELNYSASHLPEIVQNKTSIEPINFNLSKIDVSKPVAYYQIGLYRKINIKERKNNTSLKPKFSYSQIGIKGGYMDLSTHYFQNTTGSQTTTFLYKPSKIIQLEASYIWRRFFQFNIGVINETLPEIKTDLSIASKQNNYFCSTLGLRIPFGFIHLTTDLTGYSDGKDIVKLYGKAGISVNIGFSKKYNSQDKKYIENEVQKLKN